MPCVMPEHARTNKSMQRLQVQYKLKMVWLLRHSNKMFCSMQRSGASICLLLASEFNNLKKKLHWYRPVNYKCVRLITLHGKLTVCIRFSTNFFAAAKPSTLLWLRVETECNSNKHSSEEIWENASHTCTHKLWESHILKIFCTVYAHVNTV